MRKALLHAGDAPVFQPLHGERQTLVEGGVGAAGHQLVGTDLAQKLLEHVDHRQSEGDANSGGQAHLEARVHVVEVNVVVGDDGHLRVARVVERLAQQGRVVGETAVADVLAHADGDRVRIPAAALDCGERLADDDLAREADVVVHIELAQADRLVAANGQAHCLEALAAEGRGHQHGECMRRVGYEHGLLLRAAGAHVGGELGVVRVLELVHAQLLACGMARVDGVDKAPYAYAQRPCDIAFVDLEHQGTLVARLLHDADDLVGEIGVVPAVEVDDLHVLEVLALGCDERGGEHARMEVVDHVEQAVGEVLRVDRGDGVCCEHGDAELVEDLGQVVVDEVVVLVGAAGEDDGVLAVCLYFFHYLHATFLKLRAEGALCCICHLDGAAHKVRVDAKLLAHPLGELAVAVLAGVPVPQRAVKWHAPALRGVVGVVDHHGVALDHGAHALCRGRGALAFDDGDDGHEDAVDL